MTRTLRALAIAGAMAVASVASHAQQYAPGDVLGNGTATNPSAARVSDITSVLYQKAGSDGCVFRRNSTSVACGTIATAGITDAAVTDAKISNRTALSVWGRTSNTSGVGADIAAGSDNQIFRRFGTAVGFGSIDISQSAAVGSSILARANGGLGNATSTNHGILLGQGSSAIAVTAAMSDGQLLVGQSSADPLPKTISGDCTVAASGAITCTKVNGNTVTAGTSTITGAASKTLTFGNTLTMAGTDGSSIAFGAGGTVTYTIASGAKALATSAIASGACSSAQTDTATGTATTDVVDASFNGDPTAVTGYVPSTSGMLTVIAYPTSNTVNFKVCNNTANSITPGAITLNWRVRR